MKKEKVKRISRRKQLEEKNSRLQKLYHEYYDYGGRDAAPEMYYKTIPWFGIVPCLIFVLMAGHVLCIAIAILMGRSISIPWSLFFMSCGTITSFVGSAYFDNWKYNRRDKGEILYVLFPFCTKKCLERVQNEIDVLEPRVERAKEDYIRKQEQNTRRIFTEKLNLAAKANPGFKVLFDIIEQELGATVIKTLSPNKYGLPQDVILEAEIRNLPTFDDSLVKTMVSGREKFKISKNELRFWESYVTIAIGYKASRNRISNIVANAH